MTATIIGRSSSHFTRVARVFAYELGVSHEFEPVLDLLSLDAAHYAGNPSLKLPILRDQDATWFGTLNICRELSRRASAKLRVAWPESLQQRMAANAQELVLQGMASEVALVMATLAAPDRVDSYQEKSRKGLLGCLAWLEQYLPEVLATLPEERDLSYLEVTAFCFVTHLEWRRVVDTAPYRSLTAFAQQFGIRPSALSTPYAFDQA